MDLAKIFFLKLIFTTILWAVTCLLPAYVTIILDLVPRRRRFVFDETISMWLIFVRGSYNSETDFFAFVPFFLSFFLSYSFFIYLFFFLIKKKKKKLLNFRPQS